MVGRLEVVGDNYGIVHANPLLSVLDIVESERRCRCTIAVPWRIVESFEERGMVRRLGSETW